MGLFGWAFNHPSLAFMSYNIYIALGLQGLTGALTIALILTDTKSCLSEKYKPKIEERSIESLLIPDQLSNQAISLRLGYNLCATLIYLADSLPEVEMCEITSSTWCDK